MQGFSAKTPAAYVLCGWINATRPFAFYEKDHFVQYRSA